MTKKIRAFETARVELNIKGSNLHIVNARHITPAEFLLIQQVHGPYSVKYLEPQGPDMLRRTREDGRQEQRIRTPNELKEYLINKYGQKQFEKVFPGVTAVLPWAFDDIGVGIGKQGFGVDAPEADEEPAWETVPEQPKQKDTQPEKKKLGVDDLVGTGPSKKAG